MNLMYKSHFKTFKGINADAKMVNFIRSNNELLHLTITKLDGDGYTDERSIKVTYVTIE